MNTSRTDDPLCLCCPELNISMVIKRSGTRITNAVKQLRSKLTAEACH